MRLFLRPASFLVRLGSQAKNFFYDKKILKPQAAPFPVISVGNISFGGTEKTPLAMELLDRLQKMGLRPALITRGYRGRWERKGGILSDGEKILGTWEEAGDEPFMVAQSNPGAGVFVGRDRFQSCLRAHQSGFNIGVLDDGFQHRRLRRDMDIVLVNPEEKTGLREHPSGLRRADIILVKKPRQNNHEPLKRIRPPHSLVFRYDVSATGFQKLGNAEIFAADAFREKKVMAFCGIARPQRFSALLEKTGADVVFFLRFPDHHRYPPRSLKRIRKAFEDLRPEAVLATEKDAVKIAGCKDFLEKVPVHIMHLGLNIDTGFYGVLQSLIWKGHPQARQQEDKRRG